LGDEHFRQGAPWYGNSRGLYWHRRPQQGKSDLHPSRGWRAGRAARLTAAKVDRLVGPSPLSHWLRRGGVQCYVLLRRATW